MIERQSSRDIFLGNGRRQVLNLYMIIGIGRDEQSNDTELLFIILVPGGELRLALLLSSSVDPADISSHRDSNKPVTP